MVNEAEAQTVFLFVKYDFNVFYTYKDRISLFSSEKFSLILRTSIDIRL